MRKGTRNSRINKKGAILRRSAKDTAWKAASFHPAIGLAKTTHGTARSAVRTARAARDYGNELYREAKRQIRKLNPFI